ncbi:hypothetical protein BDR04DRAFT_1164107 [Suillus decipiens]|nr:hypothetical protein BDR04DRAFT_1164107 [Suillus decipiens]
MLLSLDFFTEDNNMEPSDQELHPTPETTPTMLTQDIPSPSTPLLTVRITQWDMLSLESSILLAGVTSPPLLKLFSDELNSNEAEMQLLTESEREDPGRDDPDESNSLSDASIPETIIWPVEEIPSPPSKTEDKLIAPLRPHIPTHKPLAPTLPFSTLST